MKLRKKYLREAIQTAIIVLGIFSFRYSIAEPFVVPTGSMEPTIMPGDRLLVMKSAYHLRIPFTDVSLANPSPLKRGDVVVFKYPVDPSIYFVKRLIGLPGDQVEVTDGKIRINGRDLAAVPAQLEAATDPRYQGSSLNYFQETLDSKVHWVQRLPHEAQLRAHQFRVPEGKYFFMGDNRDDSSDSRSWGFVPASYIQGKAVGVWLSINSWSRIIPSIRWERLGTVL